MAFDLGQKLFGGSQSKQDPSKVFPQQAPYLAALYNRAYQQSMGGGIPGYGTPLGFGMQPPMMGMGQPTVQAGGPGGVMRPGMGAGSYGASQYNPNQLASGIYGQNWERSGGRSSELPPLPAGMDPVSVLGGQLLGQGVGMNQQLGMLGQVGNPFAMGQIGQLGQGLGRLFSQQIAPTIGRQFAASGTYGGDRQALALGQAAEGLGQQFTTGALDILGGSAGLALSANQAGLGSLGALFGLGNQAMFGSLPGLASLLGQPTVLGGGGNSNQFGGWITGIDNSLYTNSMTAKNLTSSFSNIMGGMGGMGGGG